MPASSLAGSDVDHIALRRVPSLRSERVRKLAGSGGEEAGSRGDCSPAE